jgi:hypothetical protein
VSHLQDQTSGYLGNPIACTGLVAKEVPVMVTSAQNWVLNQVGKQRWVAAIAWGANGGWSG